MLTLINSSFEYKECYNLPIELIIYIADTTQLMISKYMRGFDYGLPKIIGRENIHEKNGVILNDFYKHLYISFEWNPFIYYQH